MPRPSGTERNFPAEGASVASGGSVAQRRQTGYVTEPIILSEEKRSVEFSTQPMEAAASFSPAPAAEVNEDVQKQGGNGESWQDLRTDRKDLQLAIGEFLQTQRMQLDLQQAWLSNLEELSTKQQTRFEKTLLSVGSSLPLLNNSSSSTVDSVGGSTEGSELPVPASAMGRGESEQSTSSKMVERASENGLSQMDDDMQTGSRIQVEEVWGEKRLVYKSKTDNGETLALGGVPALRKQDTMEQVENSVGNKEMFMSLQAKTNHSLLYSLATRLGMATAIDRCWFFSVKKRLPLVLQQFSNSVVGNERFTTLITLFIMSNAIFIAISADHTIRQSIESWRQTEAGKVSIAMPHQPFFLDVSDMIFAIVFTVEWVLRLLAFEVLFLVGPEWKWNYMDTIVVASAWMDILMSVDDITFLRIFRVLRVLRTLRIIRVLRFFRELRVMLLSLLGSIMSLMWALICLSMIIFVFGIFFLQGVATFIQEAKGGNQEASELAEMFESFPTTFLVLFSAITGGEDWMNVHKPLEAASPLYGTLFLVYVSVMVFGVLNVITGIFVENATARARNDRELAREEEMTKSYDMMKHLMHLFKEVDENMSGTVTYKEWMAFCAKPEAQACFSLLEIDISKTKDLFKLIDTDKSHEVDLEEFVMSCMKLQGAAKAVDLEAMLQNNKKLVESSTRQMDDMVKEIKGQLSLHLSENTKLTTKLSNQMALHLGSLSSGDLVQGMKRMESLTTQVLTESQQARLEALPPQPSRGMPEQVLPAAPSLPPVLAAQAGKDPPACCGSDIVKCV